MKLKAVDKEDMTVIAASLQDALVLIDDIAYFPEDEQFVFVANRYQWETDKAGAKEHARTTTGVTFSKVTAVRRKGVDRRDGDGMLSLLTIEVLPGALQLTFSGGAAIRLEVSGILCHLQDVGEPWPTRWRPDHASA
ncbi:hypothetical protein GCM10011611_61210 [Aliidongia dinghuensis]|uniref:DUF2948 family protein n=1 Tax=Aliidongia dinghuensis TaxID=1867774 RepID=A0A8J3E7N9_9PROT|nr:DUF2948 family protein [Aliidongia dinghuensis]GGF46545.1 hypothetical protein GCM10011611_61210 [Aliidongia dinghuensis]